MKPPRILHVTTVHPPFDNRIFGMEARSLAAAGFDVTLATTVAEADTRDGVRLFPLGAMSDVSRRGERLGRNARALAAMRAAYDIVHIHDPELLLAAAAAQRLFGRAIVYDVHEFYDEKFGGGDVTADWIPRPMLALVRHAYRSMEAAVLPRSGGVVVVSDAMIERYRRYLGEERIALVQNYPNLTTADVMAARRSQPPLSEPYVLHTGGASRNRSFEIVVAAAESLRRQGVRAPIVNLGPIQLEGYAEHERRDLMERSKAADVRNLGSVSHAEALRWIAHAAVGYLPIADNENNRRGQPRKLFEYFLFGLPVVTSDVGRIGSAVRDRSAGISVSPYDADSHAKALAEILNEPCLYARLSANAQAAASGLSFSSQLPRLIALYERILRATPGGVVAPAA